LLVTDFRPTHFVVAGFALNIPVCSFVEQIEINAGINE